MGEIEVKATRTFQHPLHVNGTFLRGRFYRVDADDRRVQGLIAGGYFKVIEPVEEVTDDQMGLAGVDAFLDSGVGARRTRPAKRKKEQAGELDGPDQLAPRGNSGDGTTPDATAGTEDGAGGS